MWRSNNNVRIDQITDQKNQEKQMRMKKQQKVPDQEHKQRDRAHALDAQAVLQVLHRTSQLYENREQNLYPDLCENVQVRTNFSRQSASLGTNTQSV